MLFVYTVREYINVSKQIKSVCKVANSPVMIHVNETIDGAITVRTFENMRLWRSILGPARP